MAWALGFFLYVGAALPPLTKSDRRCYYSLEKVTMICWSTTVFFCMLGRVRWAACHLKLE